MGERNDLIARLIQASKTAYDAQGGEGLRLSELLAEAFATIACLTSALEKAHEDKMQAIQQCAEIADKEADFWDDHGTSARIAAANIRRFVPKDPRTS